MTTEKHFIDQLFKEKLGNFEQDPPVGLLEQIDQKMVYRSKIRRVNQLKAVIGMAAAVMLIAMAGWWYTTEPGQVVRNEVPQPIRQAATPGPATPEKAPANQVATSKVKSTAKATAQTAGALPVRKIRQNNTLADQNNIVPAQPAPTGQSTARENSTSGAQTASHQTHEDFARKSMIDEAAVAARKEKKSAPLYFADAGFKPNNAPKEAAKGNWGIKAEISPMWVSQNQTGSTSSPKAGSSLSGGMLASYTMNDKITISSGIRISQMKQENHTDYTMAKTSGITYLEPVQKDADLSSDVALHLPSVSSIVYSNGMQSNLGTVFSSDVAQEFKYLEVPVQATYNLVNKKISVGITGGLSTNFLISNFASVTENGIILSQGSTNNIRDVLYSGSAGIEVGYDLGKNLILTVEPRVKQYINSISSNDQVNFKPTQLGLFTGITYYFK